MRNCRLRTESMAERLSNKPIQEGYDLWDKGIRLGAMRLFIFKGEFSPPFQLCPCLDAVATILYTMNEMEDAAENFQYASEKYKVTQQEFLSSLMQVRHIQCSQGNEVAYKAIEALIQEHDADKSKAVALPETDQKRGQIARAYYIKAEIASIIAKALPASENTKKDELLDGALVNAKHCVALGVWDRKHYAHNLIGDILVAKGAENDDAAIAEYKNACELCKHFLAPHLNLFAIYRRKDQIDKALESITLGIEIHPRSAMIKDKAFLLSEMGNDQAALDLLNENISNPPIEETDEISTKDMTKSTLLKARAVILADMERYADALEDAKAAKLRQTDDDVDKMIHDFSELTLQEK